MAKRIFGVIWRIAVAYKNAVVRFSDWLTFRVEASRTLALFFKWTSPFVFAWSDLHNADRWFPRRQWPVEREIAVAVMLQGLMILEILAYVAAVFQLYDK